MIGFLFGRKPNPFLRLDRGVAGPDQKAQMAATQARPHQFSDHEDERPGKAALLVLSTNPVL